MQTRATRTHHITEDELGIWRERQGWTATGAADSKKEPWDFIIETVASLPEAPIAMPSLMEELIAFSGVTRSLLEAVEAKDGDTSASASPP